MAFACVHIPEFSIQAVIRNEPGLRGHALALLEGTPPQCRVVAANKAALLAGIRAGMAKAQAEQFAALVRIRRRSAEQEKNAHAALLDLGASFSPRLEDTAPESILLDLSGLESLFGSEEAIAQRLWQRARALGFEAHVAIASNPDTALHAARGSSSLTVIRRGEEARLGPLPISVLGASAKALETLHRWGVRTCAALAALPVLDLSERLGPEGVRLHEWARGTARRSLVLAEPPLSFEEELTVDYEISELEPLSFLLSRLIEALCVRLEAHSLAAGMLRLRLRLARPAPELSLEGGGPVEAGEVHYQKAALQNETALPKKAEAGWFAKVLSLPVPSRNAKLLLNLLRLQLQKDPPGAPVSGVFLKAEPARSRAMQGGFFAAAPDPEKLELTLAKLSHLTGESRAGSPELLDTHRPDAFQMRRFAPGASDMSKKRPQAASQPGEPAPAVAGKLETQTNAGFRVFRPAVPARVHMREGRPAKVFFRGPGGGFEKGEVRIASGPWRASGEWWANTAWQREEWDLEIAFEAGEAEPTVAKSRTNCHFGESAAESGACTPWRASDVSAQPQGCCLHSEAMTGKTGEPKALQRIGLYRLAYDPVRDIWLVRGMFD